MCTHTQTQGHTDVYVYIHGCIKQEERQTRVNFLCLRSQGRGSSRSAPPLQGKDGAPGRAPAAGGKGPGGGGGRAPCLWPLEAVGGWAPAERPPPPPPLTHSPVLINACGVRGSGGEVGAAVGLGCGWGGGVRVCFIFLSKRHPSSPPPSVLLPSPPPPGFIFLIFFKKDLMGRGGPASAASGTREPWRAAYF